MHHLFHALCAVLLGSRVINNQGAWMKSCKLEVERSGCKDVLMFDCGNL